MTGQTIESCVSLCRLHRKRYAALQAGFACFCGADGVAYDKYGKAPDSECYVPCKGNPSQICGGLYRNNIFDLSKITINIIGLNMFISLLNVL